MIPTLTFCLAAFAVAGPAKPSVPPPALAGTWDVEHVAVDQQDAVHWGIRPEDPRLLGRKLVISAERVQFELGKEIGCTQSSWRARKTTWGFLFAKGFPRPEDGPRNPNPTPADFGVSVAKRAPATAYSLCPSSPASRGLRFPGDCWVALRSPDELALHYDNQVLLLLRRRPPEAKPVASFDCAKAATPTEKAICTDIDLASWDRSVAQAFREALERGRMEEKELRSSQEEWLRTRDACGSNAECIARQQDRRVNELTMQ